MIMAGGPELAIYVGEDIGRIDPRSINWRDSVLYSTSSKGKLASLNNLIGVFEVAIDAEGNFSKKAWEWNLLLVY
jgi:hypothetical protein